jgi:hypothetical protein
VSTVSRGRWIGIWNRIHIHNTHPLGQGLVIVGTGMIGLVDAHTATRVTLLRVCLRRRKGHIGLHTAIDRPRHATGELHHRDRNNGAGSSAAVPVHKCAKLGGLAANVDVHTHTMV